MHNPIRLTSFDEQNIPSRVKEIMLKLHQHHFEAYLVGGCVRDSLLGIKPKDFDVVTNAKPEEVRAIFRNCRLVGRRFKLAHIVYGRDFIEVATFRGQHCDDASSSAKEKIDYRHHSGHTHDGMIVRDNVYGTLEEDIHRRDFRINALYYDIQHHSIIDEVNGQEDLQQGIIRSLGDPQVRFAEDPVRMLRAVRFAAKLNFVIAPQELSCIEQQKHLLERISRARIFDESLKLLQGGYGKACYYQLKKHQLFETLFPSTWQCLQEDEDLNCENFLLNALDNTDLRISQGKSVNPAFLLAVLLWHPMLKRKEKILHQEAELHPSEATLDAVNQIIREQQEFTTIPKRLSFMIKDIWLFQSKLEQPKSSRQILSVFQHKRFRGAYDFMELRYLCGEKKLKSNYQWWTELQTAEPSQQKINIQQKIAKKRRKKGKQTS